MDHFFSVWSKDQILAVIGIIVSALIAIAVFLLQRRLTDKQRVDHRFRIEKTLESKLDEIKRHNGSSKVQLYNTKLINKRSFPTNRRNIIWGIPYHAAGLYGTNFDGVEFATRLEEWNGTTYNRIGVIPYEDILGIKPDGDGSFQGFIFYVKPRMIQRDKFSISYKYFRYYKSSDTYGMQVKKPSIRVVEDCIKKSLLTIKYIFYVKWKLKRGAKKNGQ